jgi:hypothetical protein
VDKDINQVIAWNDGSKSGLEYLMEFISKMLNPSVSDSSALFLGDLIAKVVVRSGDLIAPILPNLLKAVTERLSVATSTTFIQSFVMIYAHLIQSQLGATLDFLSSLNVQGRSGLDVVLSIWLDNSIYFQGYYSLKLKHGC